MLNIFSCCFHRRHDSNEQIDTIDERTRLLPSPSELISPNAGEDMSGAPASHHQRIKERMGIIVRSKESKMVNVNARLPFNLHNHPLPSNGPHGASSSQSLSSSSRSMSRTDIHTTRAPSAVSQSSIQVHVGAPLSALSSPSTSTSRPPGSHQLSQESISRSSSMVSRETGDGSVVRRREPILGLKLVRPPLPRGEELTGRRGRKKKKAMQEALEGDQAAPMATAITPTANSPNFGLDVHLKNEATPRPPRQEFPPHTVLTATEGRSSPTHSIDTADAPPTPKAEHHLDRSPLPGGPVRPKGSGDSTFFEISISPASISSADGDHALSGSDDDDEARKAKAIKIMEAKSFAIRDDGPLSISWGD